MRGWRWAVLGTVLLAATGLCPAAGGASPLKADETVIFFPTAATLEADGSHYRVPVHGWVFEPEEGSWWRGALLHELLAALEVPPESAESLLFRERAGFFLADNERGKRLRVRIAERDFNLSKSGANGHFEKILRVPKEEAEGAARGGRLPFALVTPAGDGRSFEGRVELLAPTGISVISDLDDTIKESSVLDKKELLANTFLREFKAVQGMAGLYRSWKERGAAFHYLSASPWQLAPALAPFLAAGGFPEGSLHLRTFRFKDQTFFSLFSAPEKYKIPAVEALLDAFPGRRFLLVGDAGERDPEIYGEVARRNPGRVEAIFIRAVPGGDLSPERFDEAFEGLPEEMGRVFADPAEVEGWGWEESEGER